MRGVPRGFSEALLILAAACLPASAQERSRAAGGRGANVHGTVVEHETGRPLADAPVTLASTASGVATRVTNQDGLFLFEGVLPGAYLIEIRLLGYGTLQDSLRVDRGSVVVELSARLSVSPIAVEPLVVVANPRQPGWVRAFNARRATGIGTFITREEIDERDPPRVSDLLRSVPGVRAEPLGAHDYALSMRGGCRPSLRLDGVPIFGFRRVDALVRPGELAAVEVYHGSEMPAEFGYHACGVIAFWTRLPPAGSG